VLFRTHLHWKVFILPVLLSLAGIALMAVAMDQGIDPYLSLLILIIPVVAFFSAYLTWRCSEFAVTDKRVLIKTGFVSRHTLETLLTKVENIGVEQTLWGRLFNFGTLYVTGTGDKYGRTIADVLLIDGTNVNHELVKDGWCWWYWKYVAGDTELETVENEARDAKKWLWTDADPVPLWEWRNRKQ